MSDVIWEQDTVGGGFADLQHDLAALTRVMLGIPAGSGTRVAAAPAVEEIAESAVEAVTAEPVAGGSPIDGLPPFERLPLVVPQLESYDELPAPRVDSWDRLGEEPAPVTSPEVVAEVAEVVEVAEGVEVAEVAEEEPAAEDLVAEPLPGVPAREPVVEVEPLVSFAPLEEVEPLVPVEPVLDVRSAAQVLSELRFLDD
ncbi:hypothetical protein [Nocardioides sp. YIM 152588]|uniref:hypothetical protein n=1 Tax=Nocardioides sp. YIM 152588 TaxID=3158259 RepID=UPI0032E52FEB